MVSDRILGWSLVGLSSAFISFYTMWVVLLPFVDKEQAIHQYFPDRFYAVAFPLLSGVIGLLLIDSVEYFQGSNYVVFIIASLPTGINFKQEKMFVKHYAYNSVPDPKRLSREHFRICYVRKWAPNKEG